MSIQTVSRVLNEKGEISQETRQRVLQVIEHLGYRPNTLARSLITRRTLTIGLIIPDVTNPFFPEIVHGAEQVALEQGYTIMLCNTNESAERELAILDILETRRVDGFLFCSSRLTDEQLLARLRRYREVMLINRRVAIGALQACAERNVRVPETLAVVGYDDIPAACLVVPALTTVAVAKSALGACGVALLLKRLAGDQERSEQLLPPHLIVRASAP